VELLVIAMPESLVTNNYKLIRITRKSLTRSDSKFPTATPIL